MTSLPETQTGSGLLGDLSKGKQQVSELGTEPRGGFAQRQPSLCPQHKVTSTVRLLPSPFSAVLSHPMRSVRPGTAPPGPEGWCPQPRQRPGPRPSHPHGPWFPTPAAATAATPNTPWAWSPHPPPQPPRAATSSLSPPPPPGPGCSREGGPHLGSSG